MRTSLLVALGAWFMIVSSVLLLSTSAARKRLDRRGDWLHSCEAVPKNKAKKCRENIEASAAVGGVSLFAASLVFSVAAWLALGPKKGEVALTIGSTEITVACRPRERRDSRKKANAWLCATVLALLGVLEAAVLVGFVAGLKDSKKYFLLKCHRPRYRDRVGLYFKDIRKQYLPFGITALVLSGLTFLFFANKLFKDRTGVAFADWLQGKCDVLGGVLEAVVEDDDDEDDEAEGLVHADRTKDLDAERGTTHRRDSPSATTTSSDVVAAV